MDQKPNNPLFKHFRQPAIYMQLPSNGQYWPDSALEMSATGELPVYPMTARDEITIRTPDALLNGQGVVDVIHSCCPNIKDAWKMPSIDVDAVLLNIRIASYGNNMDIDTSCPKCNDESNFSLDLGRVTGQISMPNYEELLDINGLSIKLKPQPYFEVNKVNQITFTEQQILRTINDDSVSDEEKKTKTDAWLAKLVDLNIQICANCTDYILTEDGVKVTDIDFITEFYNMADFKVMRHIQDKLKEIVAQASLKPIDVTCKGCENQYQIPMDFDYANFFA